MTNIKIIKTYYNKYILLLHRLKNTKKSYIKIYISQPVNNGSGEEDDYERSVERNSEK